MKYYCFKTKHSFKIDGNIEKAEWQAAKAVELVDTATGCKPKQHTWAKLLWNEEFLFVAFYCVDNEINAVMTEYNDKIYNEEVVEIFIDDNRDKKTYIEIEVNPLNTVLHYCIHNDLQNRIIGFARNEKTIESAVVHDDEKGAWSVEIAIPFSEFITAAAIPPREGDCWLMNLYRIDRPKNGIDEYTAWSPTGKINFHIPEKFGELIFDCTKSEH